MKTAVALVQALRDGPGYGRELIRRVASLTEGELRLSPGRVYPALKSLAAARLISRRRVSAGGARGARSRICYELTERGILASAMQRRVLGGLVRRNAPSLPDAGDRDRMVARLLEAGTLAELGTELRDAMRRHPR